MILIPPKFPQKEDFQPKFYIFGRKFSDRLKLGGGLTPSGLPWIWISMAWIYPWIYPCVDMILRPRCGYIHGYYAGTDPN